MGNLLGASFGKNKASEDIKEEKPKEEQKFSLFSALGGQKLEDKEQKEVVPTTREKLHFLDMKKAFLGMEAPPKVDKGIVRLKCHGKNLIFRHYGNGISYQNPIRYFCIKVISWKWFENFILLCIAMNSFALAFYDYSMQDKDNNYRIDMVSAIVTVIFLFEAAMKIIAMGFGFYRYTYIADPWNILDFLICVTGVSDFMG